MRTQAPMSRQAYDRVADAEFEEARLKDHDRSHILKSGFQLNQAQWQPFSLRPIGLIFFATILVCILAALIATWFYARGHQGISLITTNHYTWTFGPTTIFILVISYWRLVDYHSKALTPWAELANGPSPADRTLSLDYVSPLLPTAFWRASKRRHYAVCIGIIGFLILKIITIASTGLFLRQTITVGPFEQEMRQTSQFDTRTNFSDPSDPGASPFYQAYAIMQLGLPLPSGLTHELLYETYAPVTDQINANATYLVRSRAFVPRVHCESIDVDPLIDESEFGTTGVQQEALLQIQNNSLWICPSETGTAEDGLNLHFTDPASRLAPARQLLSSFGTIDCQSDNQSDTDTQPYFVALSDLRFNQTFNVTTANISIGDMIEPATWDFEVKKVTGMLCTIDYDMVDVDVLYNTSLTGNQAQSVSKLDVSDSSRLQTLSNQYLSHKLGYAAPTTISGARDMFGTFANFEYAEEKPHTVLTMVAERAGTDLKHLIDQPQTFKEATEYVLNHMILQLAKQAVVIPETNSTFVPQQASSQEHHHEERLVMQRTSFGVIVAGIAVLLLLTAAMLVLCPRSSMCANPESVSTQISILKASDGLNMELQQLATFSEESAKSMLDQSTYQMNAVGSAINVCSSRDVSTPGDIHGVLPTGPRGGYKPITLTKALLGLTLLSAPLAIGLLEGLQRLSDSGLPGIVTIETDDSFLISLYSRFLPALIALLIATQYNCLDFNTIVLAPFNRLVSDRGSYEEFGTPITAHVAPVAIWTALKRHYWAASLTGLGALVGSVLTIVVSGLYTVENVPMPQEVLVSQADSWNMSFVQRLQQTDHAATAVSSLIESANLSYPQFTYDELAFPALSADSGFSGSVAVITPALRADLSCEEVPWETSNTTWGSFYKGVYSPTINFNVTIPLPETCHFGSCHGNESFVRATLLSVGLEPTTNTTYFGQVIDLHTGPWRADDDDCDIFFSPSGTVVQDQNINQPGCPSLAIVYGYFDGADLSKQTWTTLVCEQRVQQVNTALTLGSPAANILLDPKPAPDESTAKYIESGSNGEKAFGWWLNGNMEYSYTMFNESAIDPLLLDDESAVSNDNPDFSNFFRGAFFGRTPLALETMKRNDTDAKDTIFTHLNMFYRRYMAQYISANLRVAQQQQQPQQPAKRDDQIIGGGGEALTGSFTPDAGVPRLVQHRTPKIVLQSMLAFMFVCAVAALGLGQYRDLVPWNPCTIAGVMVLFAGSKMCGGPTKASGSLARGDDNGTDDRNWLRSGAGHEMAALSSSGVSDKGHVLLGARKISLDQSWKNEGARFRLGWWQDGVYMGQMRERNAVREGGGWRYGIDVI